MKNFLIVFLLAALAPVASLAEMPRTDYEFVPASQTAQVLGPVGAQGDVLEKLIIIPATTGAGVVSIKDGASGDARTIFVSGTLADLSPITLSIGARSSVGAWHVTTGANVSVMAVGRFR